MILVRLSRTRSTSWLAALVWMSAVLAGTAAPRASADRERLSQAIAARVAPAGPVARLVAQDRSFDGLLLAPPERTALRDGIEHSATQLETTPTTDGASRPRRLAFRYDATAPPRAL